MYLLTYILVFPILWIISILPFKLFYFLSDCIYLLVYYIIGYRKKVVRNNLTLVFPKKSPSEIISLEKKFYKHMCDMFLEMIKTLSISDAEMKKRFHITNIEYLQDMEKRKNVMIMASHYASWEWAIIMQKELNNTIYGVYKQLKNPYFDKMVRGIRSKYNCGLLRTKETISQVLKHYKTEQKVNYAFVSDQSPKLSKAIHWKDFMGIHVPVYTAAEMLAKKCDMAVCYLKVEKVKRGYYRATYVPIAENANSFKEHEITDLFLEEVEKQLYAEPEYYLWTHKRWKHRNKKPNN